jgi:hypothetical protein
VCTEGRLVGDQIVTNLELAMRSPDRKPIETGVPMKTADISILLVLFLAFLAGLSALGFLTRYYGIPPGPGLSVGSSGDVRSTPMPPTAPIPRQESSQK